LPGRRLVVVNYDYPPAPGVGGTRWLTMKKYLERMGHEVTIVTTSAFGSLANDATERVVRTADLVSSQTLRRMLRRPGLSAPGKEIPVEKPPPAVLTSVIVPDIYAVTWAPAAARAMRRIVRERRIDAVITSSPKDSTHLAGLSLRMSRAAWLAEFRDGWMYESTRKRFPTGAQRALDGWLESLVVRRADATVSVTDALTDYFRRRYRVDAACVTNGWDPELADEGSHENSPSSDVPRERPVRLAYTGSLGTGSGRYASAGLFEALRRLAHESPEVASRLEVLMAGRRTTRDVELLASLDCGGVIRHIGDIPRADAIRLQRSADALLLIGSDTTVATGKLFEYLGADRPILHVGRAGAAARILDETGRGITVEHDDVPAILGQLDQVANGTFGECLADHGIQRYSYPGLAEAMSETIETAIARRRERR
jgi:glycosyltransferase involved in cell wall biosynthesis